MRDLADIEAIREAQTCANPETDSRNPQIDK
jgi:hypothetical protein